MNNSDLPQNPPVIPLKDALLRLSVSPVKADREAISRIERETAKDIHKIIQDLDSVDITLKAIDEKPIPFYGTLKNRIGWGVFCSSLIGTLALFSLSVQRLPFAIALGFVLGVSLPFMRRDRS